MFPLRRPFCLFLLLFSCACHSPGTNDRHTLSRTGLIAALKDMESRISSRDSASIAYLFRFPVPDSVMRLFLNDSAYNKWRLTHAYLPREAFDTLLPQILDDWDLDMFKDFFRHIDYDKLSIHNDLRRVVSEDAEPCDSHFGIRVEGDSLVHIYYGSADNPGYVPPSPPKQRDPGECRHAIYWTLSWDQKKLTVIHQAVAD